jgi:uncharacterized membrane protein YiaA
MHGQNHIKVPQHVSGVFTPIIRKADCVFTAYGYLSCCDRCDAGESDGKQCALCGVGCLYSTQCTLLAIRLSNITTLIVSLFLNIRLFLSLYHALPPAIQFLLPNTTFSLKTCATVIPDCMDESSERWSTNTLRDRNAHTGTQSLLYYYCNLQLYMSVGITAVVLSSICLKLITRVKIP